MKKLSIKVKPNAKQQEIKTGDNGELIVRLQSPPVDGKANTELIKLLAKTYGVKKSQIRIKSGLTSKIKQVEIN
ncbi:DUF167 domain-containing protein [Euhalothece natronophila Z-M001]|uniref:UPF0235 protein FRE64_11675 n=1 Tax=Euhalothece natronophila Z-M001 TaxID=522448 RepID=A0A5B8NQR6_9CHRO|nr:DUF167 domain-containing protein [Euhalothece natronophila]QDZ40555.1 DUF167 domain-containing protein [Euhalothece natronophila Z-M001]